jgi:CDP-glycerol glycerophosphotransferase (TagB/SpsB family)
MRGYLEAIRRGDLAMSFPDYRDTHDVLASVDAVISPLSTIIVEAAMHAKPVMCFLPHEEVDAKHFQLAAHMPHFTDLFENPDVVIARSRADLIAQVKRLVEQTGDAALKQRLVDLSHFFVTPHDAPYPERLVRFVEEVAVPTGRRPAPAERSAA